MIKQIAYVDGQKSSGDLYYMRIWFIYSFIYSKLLEILCSTYLYLKINTSQFTRTIKYKRKYEFQKLRKKTPIATYFFKYRHILNVCFQCGRVVSIAYSVLFNSEEERELQRFLLDICYTYPFAAVIFFSFRRGMVWPPVFSQYFVKLISCQQQSLILIEWKQPFSSSVSHCWILYHWISIWFHWDLPNVAYANLWVSLLHFFPGQHCLLFCLLSD